MWGKRKYLLDLKQAGATICCYVFDGWNVQSFFNNRQRKLQRKLNPNHRLRNLVDRLCLPFRSSLDDFEEEDRHLLMHVPLGVDTSLVDGFNPARPISVLAYGRQPRGLTTFLAKRLNAPDVQTILHHTDHASIGEIHDFTAHRLHFWKLAQSALIAVAYDPRVTHPERFPVSIVGQRWFECLSAGCVIVGKRPATDEANLLMDWEDSTIELPDDFDRIPGFLTDLMRDTARLSSIRERNVDEVRKRHDWRFRITDIMQSLSK